MAQGFTAISTSLGEAERVKDGKAWTANDYAEHQKHYNIDPNRTYLNSVLISANGMNERELVNHAMIPEMLRINQAQIDKVNDWNEQHSEPDPDRPGKTRMQVNPKTGKQYGKRSINKTRMYPVGAYVGKGTRAMPYDVFKLSIEKGNARGKEADSTRMRTSVLQQYAVAWGNSDEWQKDPVRKTLRDAIHGDDPKRAKQAKTLFEKRYVKPYLEKFQKENPSLKIVQAVVHYDETNPHLQFTVLPHVDGKEYGGLGSTAYTGAIQHDHPDFPASDVVAKFYQQQHDDLRKQIKTVNSGVVDSKHNPLKMALGDRPGTHKSHRVDIFAKMQEDNDKQLAYLADAKATADKMRQSFGNQQALLDAQKQSLDQQKAEQEKKKAEQEQRDVEQDAKADELDSGQAELEKQRLAQQKQMKRLKIREREAADATQSVVDAIKLFNPDHTIPALGEDAKPVKTEEGTQQHLQQPLSYLVKVMKHAMQRAIVALTRMNRKVKQGLDLAQVREDLEKPKNGAPTQASKKIDNGPDM